MPLGTLSEETRSQAIQSKGMPLGTLSEETRSRATQSKETLSKEMMLKEMMWGTPSGGPQSSEMKLASRFVETWLPATQSWVTSLERKWEGHTT